MELVKANIEKNRKVFKDGDTYIKIWEDRESTWVFDHVSLLNKLVPNYVNNYGDNWVSFNKIEGIPANTFEHTDEFITRIVDFCKTQFHSLEPYYHGDWVLSNMIINKEQISMIDYDNLAIVDSSIAWAKMKQDLISQFGESKINKEIE